MSGASTRPWLFGLTLALASCAGPRPAARSFERPELATLKITSVDVVVSVAGPPVASPPVLSVATFAAPTWQSILRPSEEDALTQEAVVAALRRRLGAGGYRARFLHGGAQGLPVTAAEAVETSTAPAGLPKVVTSSVNRPLPPSPAPLDEAPLGPQASLRSVLDASEADAVLVVRAVPVDAFYVFEESSGRQRVTTGSGIDDLSAAQGSNSDRAVMRSGRLLFGQAFLFDRRTGLRLWSRQLPGFPADGRLTPDSPLLQYGYVSVVGAKERMPEDKAGVAAAAFAKAMLDEFPDARATEAPDARAQLASIDVSEEMAIEGFLDQAHLTLALDMSWSVETAGVDILLDADSSPYSLGTGAVANSGVLRLTPQVGYQWPGGLTALFGVPLGLAPNSFARSYHLDNADPNLGDPDDIGASISLGSPLLGGGQLEFGYAWPIGARLVLEARGGGFAEAWVLDQTPAGLFTSDRLLRFGVLGSTDLTYRISDASPFFVRGGLNGRVGASNTGPVLVGGGLRLGVGVFL